MLVCIRSFTVNQPDNSVDVLSKDLPLSEALCFLSDCKFWDQIEGQNINRDAIKLQPILQPKCLQTFDESKRRLFDICLYRAVIESGLWSSLQQ